MVVMIRYKFGDMFIFRGDKIMVICGISFVLKQLMIEPRHEISNNVVCATSKGSDQPTHMRSLIRTFANGMNIL